MSPLALSRLLTALSGGATVLVLTGTALGLGPGARGRLERLRACPPRVGVRRRPGPLLYTTVAAAAVTATVTGRWWGAPIGGVSAVVLAAIRAAAARRRWLESGERQVEGLCMGLVSNLRAGQGLPDALRSAVARSGPPLQAVLDRALSRHHAGVPLLTALEEAATAARLRGLRYLVDVLAIYQYGGGDLSSLLTLTAGTLKERRILRQQARARTTEARLSVRLLAGLPLVVGVYLLLWQPWVLEPLVQYPAGRLGLAAGAGCWLMGIAVTGYMLRTVDGEVEA